eukprot:NODE_77_length_23806_cov_0.393892.p20 type:complete len:101 gc:universal NODE_77_length_23806_cov_0.393892:13083-12781(-)
MNSAISVALNRITVKRSREYSELTNIISTELEEESLNEPDCVNFKKYYLSLSKLPRIQQVKILASKMHRFKNKTNQLNPDKINHHSNKLCSRFKIHDIST